MRTRDQVEAVADVTSFYVETLNEERIGTALPTCVSAIGHLAGLARKKVRDL